MIIYIKHLAQCLVEQALGSGVCGYHYNESVPLSGAKFYQLAVCRKLEKLIELFLPSFKKCVCVCIPACASHVHIQRSKDNFFRSLFLSSILLKQFLLFLLLSPALQASRLPTVFLSLSHLILKCWCYRWMLPCPAFYVGSRNQTQIIRLVQQAFFFSELYSGPSLPSYKK